MTTDEIPHESKDELLADWAARLADELGLQGLEVNVDAILALAGVAAHSVLRPAAPLTTFLVGYAAGIAVAEGRLLPEPAVEAASAAALLLARAEAERVASRDESGSTGTAS
jgi:hypothetical protein